MELRVKNRIDSMFGALAAKHEKALITYIMAGDPDLPTTEMLVKTLAAGGADLIELGVPFSDPVADGLAIQRAGQRSLEAGASLQAILDLVRSLRQDTEVPLVLMSYYNPILQYGLAEFAAQAALVGVDGVIVPDLPLEESVTLAELLAARGAYLVPLLAPTSTAAKIAKVAAQAGGFVYCVSLTGVTGTRTELPLNVGEFLARVRERVPRPLAVGFGIATPEQARQLSSYTDGVIVGSAIVNLIEQYGADKALLHTKIKQFVANLKAGLKA